jgi:toxin-antitoxin system PIN domain toxin
VILPDVNVLLYAFRTDSHEHNRYKDWLEEVVNGPAAYGMSPQVLSSVVRIATHPRIFRQPSSLESVLEFAAVLLAQPNCTVIHPGARHWEIFGRIASDCRATGNLVQDAWFAALAIESGCEWITTDRDYARFKGLRWRPPF